MSILNPQGLRHFICNCWEGFIIPFGERCPICLRVAYHKEGRFTSEDLVCECGGSKSAPATKCMECVKKRAEIRRRLRGELRRSPSNTEAIHPDYAKCHCVTFYKGQPLKDYNCPIHEYKQEAPN